MQEQHADVVISRSVPAPRQPRCILSQWPNILMLISDVGEGQKERIVRTSLCRLIPTASFTPRNPRFKLLKRSLSGLMLVGNESSMR